MKLLGIDYGRKKIGLAVAESRLAQPLKVIRYSNLDTALEEIESLIDGGQIEKIVIGISEGRMARESRDFAEKLKGVVGKPIEFQDETLTTQAAQELSIKAGIKRKKRRQLEDAYSASLILQRYLDDHN